MGNQLAKQQDSQKKYRLVNISRSRSIINDHRSNNGSSSSSSSTPTPVRHQVVISDSTSKTIPLLSSSSTRRRMRQHTSHSQRYDTHSLSSLNTSDDEPGTPTAAAANNQQQPLNSLDASTTTTSSLVDGWPSNYHMNPSTMIVFDSAIASAESAAEDNRKRRDSAGTAVTQKKKNTQLYEYGEEKEYNRYVSCASLPYRHRIRSPRLPFFPLHIKGASTKLISHPMVVSSIDNYGRLDRE